MMKFKFLSIVFIGLSYFSNAQSVSIGKQIWTTNNLDVRAFRNGDEIPQAKTDEEWKKAGKNGQPAWCFYDNKSGIGNKYGKLYNWYAVNDPRGLAPSGWHIPSDSEWDVLLSYLGFKTDAKYRDYSGEEEKLINKIEWTDKCPKFPHNGTKNSGFSALLGGTRDFDGEFVNQEEGLFWSATEPNTLAAWYYNIKVYETKRFCGVKERGMSVRCVKD